MEQLRKASRKGDLKEVMSILENKEIYIAQTALDSSLVYASAYGYLDVVKYLVKHNADVNAQEGNPLTDASMRGHLDVVKFLVENGANVNMQNSHALQIASINGYLDIVKFLVQNGADITVHHNAPIRIASEYKRVDVVEYFLLLGQDPIDVDDRFNNIYYKPNSPENVLRLYDLAEAGVAIERLRGLTQEDIDSLDEKFALIKETLKIISPSKDIQNIAEEYI